MIKLIVILLIVLFLVYIAKDYIPKYKIIEIGIIIIISIFALFTILTSQITKPDKNNKIDIPKEQLIDKAMEQMDTYTETKNSNIIGGIGDEMYIATNDGDITITIDSIRETNNKGRILLVNYTVKNINYNGGYDNIINVNISSKNFNAYSKSGSILKIKDEIEPQNIKANESKNGRLAISLNEDTQYIELVFLFRSVKSRFEFSWKLDELKDDEETIQTDILSEKEVETILKSDYIKCNVSELLEIINNDNKIKSEEYNKKRIKLTGKIYEISRNKNNKICVQLKDEKGNKWSAIPCEFYNDDLKQDIMNLEEGDIVEISGINIIQNSKSQMYYCYKIEKIESYENIEKNDLDDINSPNSSKLYEPYETSEIEQLLNTSPTSVTANEIVSYYHENKNEIALESYYDKKHIAITGRIKDISTSYDNYICVTLDDDEMSSFFGISCYFPDETNIRNAIATFEIGDRVIIYGIGKVSSTYDLYDCYSIQFVESNADYNQNKYNELYQTVSDNLGPNVGPKVLDIMFNKIGFKDVDYVKRLGDTMNYQFRCETYDVVVTAWDDDLYVRIFTPYTGIVWYEDGVVLKQWY